MRSQTVSRTHPKVTGKHTLMLILLHVPTTQNSCYKFSPTFSKNQSPHPHPALYGSGAQKKPFPHFSDLSIPVGTFGFHRSQVLHWNTYTPTLPPQQYLLLLSKSHNLLQKLSIGVRFECDFKGSCKTRFWGKQQPSLARPHGVSGGEGL